ncbi:MAG TPA: amino acid ABC transporter permease [Acidisoma sp.]|nr:amino acid ABC transporter permease [Acidisoma sp.]
MSLPDRVSLEQLHSAVVVPRRYVGRWVAAAILILLMLAQALVSNSRFEWPVVWQYLFAPSILKGLGLTLELTVLATIISLIAGIGLALTRMSANPVLSTVAAAYIWFFRSVPLLVQIIFFYNFSALYPHIALGLPDFGPSFGTVNAIISPFVAALLGLCFNESAYTAETVRGGILSVNPGQWAAAKSIGFRPAQTIRYVILPQAIRVFLPPFGNQVVNLLKLTSLVSIVALADLLYSAQLIYARTFETIPLLIVASIWYPILVSILSYGQSLLERRMATDPARGARRERTRAAVDGAITEREVSDARHPAA